MARKKTIPVEWDSGEELTLGSRSKRKPTPAAKARRRKEEAEKSVIGAKRMARALFRPGPDGRERIMLRPDQMEIFNSPARYKIAACGRRWGKTTEGAAEAIIFGIQHPESLIWWSTPTYNHGTKPRYVVGYIADRMNVVQEPVSKYCVKLKNGSEIHWTSLHDAQNLLGNGVDLIIIDEAKLVPDEAMHSVLMPSLADTNGRLLAISTPGDPWGWFYDFWKLGQTKDGKSRGYESWCWPSSANPKVSEEFLKEAKKNGPAYFDREYLAKFKPLGDMGQLFTGEIIQRFLSAPENAEQDGPRILGLDCATRRGLSGAVLLNGKCVTAVETARNPEVKYVIAWVLELIKEYTPDAIGIDDTAGGQNVPELVEMAIDEEGLGVPMYRYDFREAVTDDSYANWRTEMLHLIRDDIESGELWAEDQQAIEALRRELPQVKMTLLDSGKIKHTSKKTKKSIHTQDCTDALLLARAARRDYEYDEGERVARPLHGSRLLTSWRAKHRRVVPTIW